MKLKNKTAIVTGGASGIGKAIVEKFLEAEAAGVVIADLNRKAAQKVAREFAGKYSGRVLFVKCDIADPEDVRKMAATAVVEFGRIDILVNNAGICPVVPWDRTTLKDWNRILEVNLTGAFLCTKAVIPVMRRQKYGRIVYISSTAAAVGSLAAHVAYGASKAGVLALMKSVAKGFAADGIIANAVSPGTTDTPMTDSFGSAIKKSLAKTNVMGRRGNPEEIADAVLYLVSDRAGFITGQNLKVDGGFALR